MPLFWADSNSSCKLSILASSTFRFLVISTSFRLSACFRNTSLVAKDPDTPKPEIPEDAEHLLDGTVEGNEVDTTRTLHFAAYDPAKAKKGKPQPKAHMIADDGAVTKAATPPPKKP